MTREEELRAEILKLTREYHEVAFPEKPFLGGISQIPVSGKVFDGDELSNLVDASLDFWLTTGRYAEEPPCRVRAHVAATGQAAPGRR